MLSKATACNMAGVCEHDAALDVQGSEQENERQRRKQGAKGHAITCFARISSAIHV
jgi:hypothetical protein